jgi:hypothetical protein
VSVDKKRGKWAIQTAQNFKDSELGALVRTETMFPENQMAAQGGAGETGGTDAQRTNAYETATRDIMTLTRSVRHTTQIRVEV